MATNGIPIPNTTELTDLNTSSTSSATSSSQGSRISLEAPQEIFDLRWLCEEGTPYYRYIHSLCWSNPGLRHRDPANESNPIKPGNAKVVLLETSATEPQNFRLEKQFQSSNHLGKHFAEASDDHDKRRIYIMEGLSPDFVAAVGGHFFMDPAFFLRQERTCPWSTNFTPMSDALPPPTLLRPKEMFSLQYCELRQFHCKMESNAFFCKQTGRHVGMTPPREEQNHPNLKKPGAGQENIHTTVAILRRKVSWWSRKTSKGGWDVVILCDPQLFDLRGLTADGPPVTTPANTALHEGYVDFIPPPTPEEAKRMFSEDNAAAPIRRHPHKSMLEDLCFYFHHHAHLLDDIGWEKPTTSSVFLQKIVASHYFQLIDYIKAMLPSLEFQKLGTAWIDEQNQWKMLQTISRRCGNYHDDMEDTLLSLGYPPEAKASQNSKDSHDVQSSQDIEDWRDCEKDFQYIYFRLKILKGRADTLMQSMTGLASIAGNRQNLQEAKRVKRLNLLAVFFIPLAYTSALFGMEEDYGPGKAKFGHYWGYAMAAVVITLIATWVLDQSLNEAGNLRKGRDLYTTLFLSPLAAALPEALLSGEMKLLKKGVTGKKS